MRLSVRKIKDGLRLKFEVGLGLRQIARAVARLVSEPCMSMCNEPGLPESLGRLGRIGTTTDWRLPRSAVLHGLARQRWRWRTSPSFTGSGSCTHT